MKITNVLNNGVAGDGSVDDRPAIQALIDDCMRRGGGTVYFPSGDYLLDSWVQADHPWQFFNLIVGSNVFLLGAPGSRLLQGPGGVHDVLAGAAWVRNTVLAIGPHFTAVRWQDPNENGGWYSAEPVEVNSNFVTLATPSDAAHFAEGDWVGIYDAAPDTGDTAVYRSEFQQVMAVDTKTGVIAVRDRFARAFPTAWVANITPLVTENVSVQGLVIEGTEPLAVMEAIGCAVRRCKLVFNTAIVEQRNTFGLNINSVRNFMFEESDICPVAGGAPVALEIAQRNSAYFTFKDCAFVARSITVGEYANHCQFLINRCQLYPTPDIPVAVVIGGAEVVLAANSFSCGELGHPSGAVLTDYIGLDSYAEFVTHGRFVGNSIIYSASAPGLAALYIKGNESSVENNSIQDVGSQPSFGVKCEGPGDQAIRICANRVQVPVVSSIGISLKPGGSTDCAVIGDNTVLGGGAGDKGILIDSSSPYPAAGGHSITGNVVTGFSMPLLIDYTLHPGTKVVANPDIPDHTS
jgi:hypothetical protein